MQARFGDVNFSLPVNIPGLGSSVGFTFTFFPIYILTYLLFGKIKHYIPYFASFDKWYRKSHTEAEEMMSFADLSPSKAPDTPIS
jgi:hypothetical protein